MAATYFRRSSPHNIDIRTPQSSLFTNESIRDVPGNPLYFP